MKTVEITECYFFTRNGLLWEKQDWKVNSIFYLCLMHHYIFEILFLTTEHRFPHFFINAFGIFPP